MNLQESWKTLTSQQHQKGVSETSLNERSQQNALRNAFTTSEQHLQSWHQADTMSQNLTKAAQSDYAKGFRAESDHTEHFLTFAEQHTKMPRMSTIHTLNNQPGLRSHLIDTFLTHQAQNLSSTLNPAPHENLKTAIEHSIKKAFYHNASLAKDEQL